MRLLPLVLALGCAGTRSVEKDSPSEPTTAPEPAPEAANPEVGMKIPGMRAAPRPEHAPKATAFAIALHKELAEDGKNSATSGPSALVAFSMLGAGARGQTLAEIGTLFGGTVDDAWHVDNERLLAAWNDTRGVKLASVNAVWVDTGNTLAPAYVDRVKASYGASPSELPFSADADAAAATIDTWTRSNTFGMIDKLLPAEDLKGAELVLANAVAFEGTWKVKFPEQATAPATFATATGPAEVPTMNVTLPARHTAGDGWAGLVLPYDGETTSMLLILPDAGVDLMEIESRLDHDLLARLLDAAPVDVRVSLPKFSFAVDHELNAPIAALGAPTMFGAADFTGLGLGPDIAVDKAIQKVFVKVDEQGTEAAAVTAVVMKRSAGPKAEVLAFTADRPFLFAIWHHETGVPLFLGRVVDPRG